LLRGSGSVAAQFGKGRPGRWEGGCSPFLYRRRLGVHRAVTGRAAMLGRMADFLVVAGIVGFVVAMLGLIWGLERV